MNIENPTIQGLINAMLIIIPSGAALRVISCAVAMMVDEEKRGENKRRIKNVLTFTVVAELGVVIANVIFHYFG